MDKGIPHSTFLGWSADDRAKVVAYISEQALSCMMCGTSEWEWEENPHAYEPEEKWCKGCYVKHMASEDAGKLPGTTVTLSPTNAANRIKRNLVEERRARMRRENKAEQTE